MVTALSMLMAGLCLAPPSQPQDGGDVVREARGLLDELNFGPDPGRAHSELIELGPDALPAVAEVWAEQVLARPLRSGRASGDCAALSAIVIEWPDAFLVGALDGWLSEPREAHERVAGLELLAGCARASDMRIALRVARSSVPGKPLELPVRRALEACLISVLDRDPRAIWAARDLFLGAQVEQLPSVLDAMTTADPESALEAMASLLGRVPRCEGLILHSLSRVAEKTSPPHPRDTLASIRGYLESEDPVQLEQAARLVGILGDGDAIGPLIESMASEHRAIRDSSHRALCRITGLPMPPDARRWMSWFSEEQEWWDRRSREVFEDLRSGDVEFMVPALAECSKRRLHRHELCDDVVANLGSQDPPILVLAASTLSNLESRAALPHLIRWMRSSDETVRAAARRGLVRITGQDHGDDEKAWIQAIPPSIR